MQTVPTEPTQLILIDDLDDLSLGTVTAMKALDALAYLFEGQAEGFDLRPGEIAALLRCIHSRAADRWPLRGRSC